ncbi:MAG: serine/threonine-protein kinase [Bacteroidota bacterium]
MDSGQKVVVSEHDFRRRFIYDQNSLLGEGGFAKVYRAYDRQFDETVALKFYTKTNFERYDIIGEMRSSRRFTHKNVIRVHDARIVQFTNSYGVTEDVQVGIIEYANAGNLHDFLATTPSEQAFRQVLIGILQGLNYLHTEKKVIHRDLSPDNILMVKEGEEWIPKIADFGISKQLQVRDANVKNQKVSSELVGKMEYMAPEQFDPKKFGINGHITTNVDLWSFGVILTEIFTETSPFGDRSTNQSAMQIMRNVVNNPLPSQIKEIPEPYQTMIRKCLVKYAKKRVQSSLELIEMLNYQQPVQKKKSSKPVLVALGVLLFLLACVGGWFLLDRSKGQPEIAEEPKQIEVTEILPRTDSPSLPTDSTTPLPDTKEDPTNESQLSNDEKQTQAEVNQPNTNENSFSEEDLYISLMNEIKMLDNEMINENLRKSRIDRYIERYFIGPEAKVLVQKGQTVSEQEAPAFMEYVVNTASIGTRDWKINSTQTELENQKISVLSLEML